MARNGGCRSWGVLSKEVQETTMGVGTGSGSRTVMSPRSAARTMDVVSASQPFRGDPGRPSPEPAIWWHRPRARSSHCTDVCSQLFFWTSTRAPRSVHCSGFIGFQRLSCEIVFHFLLPRLHRARGVELELEPFGHLRCHVGGVDVELFVPPAQLV